LVQVPRHHHAIACPRKKPKRLITLRQGVDTIAVACKGVEFIYNWGIRHQDLGIGT
jgi:hypothetical protein